MRDTNQRMTALLVTNDPALESAANHATKALGERLHLSKDSSEATALAFDSSPVGTIAIIDLDASCGTRHVVHTVAGLLPVIAVAEKPHPWVQEMVRHRRIRATLAKPVSPEALRNLLGRLEGDDDYGAAFSE